MVSIGIDIVEMSEESDLLVPGQTSPTITKSKLFEVSVVDIGANDEAIVLRKDGKLLTLGQGEYPLPKLSDKREKPKKPKEMELKTLALQMGLPETADEAAVGAKIAELLAKEKENEQLVKEKSEMELAGVISAVESAIAEKKIGADKKEHFVNLGKSVGIETLQATFAAMSPAVKLTEALAGGGSSAEVKTYSKFSEVPADELKRLRKENAAEYKRLYRAEYGYECEI
jgi:hypothetical protein